MKHRTNWHEFVDIKIKLIRLHLLCLIVEEAQVAEDDARDYMDG